jgi:SHS2 domain-containing protein
MTPYEELPHTADVRLRVIGDTLADLFAQAAEGMYSLMNWQGAGGEALVETLALQASDTETLLVDWLSELLYRSEVSEAVYTHFDVQAEGSGLRASVRGLRGGAPVKIIKAVTYHDLRITVRDDGVFEATITFDT